MKKKGRKGASKKEDAAENGVEDKLAENGDSSQDNEDDYEPTEKKRASKRKSGPASSGKDKENGDSRDDDDDEEEYSPEKKKKGRKSHPKEASDEDDDDEREPEPERKKSKKKASKNKEAEDSDFEDDQDKSKRKSIKRKSSSKKKDDSDDDESKNEDYEVESIQDDKMIRGVRHYLIRWKGYEPESDTWEPESTLNCPELITEYKSKPKKKRDKKKKSSTSSEANWDENDDFEVDRILEVHFKKNGKREFLVHWKGYPTSDNSWEPEENMDCKDLIQRFMAKVEKAKESDSRELRPNRAATDRFTLTMYQGAGRRASKRNVGRQRVHYHEAE